MESIYRFPSVSEFDSLDAGYVFEDSEMLEEERTCLADPSFNMKVRKMMKHHAMDEKEALLETVVSMLVNKHGGTSQALLSLLSTITNEAKAELYTNIFLHRGASPNVCETNGWTPLHFAVKNNFLEVSRSLLDHYAVPDQEDKTGLSPFQIAMDNQNDDLAAELLKYIPNILVRLMFCSKEAEPSKFNFRDLLKARMQKTCLAVLDSMTEPIPRNKTRVYYSLLESDENGFAPDHPRFDADSQIILFFIASQENKTLVEHPVVKLFIKRKWSDFAGLAFRRSALLHGLRYVALTVAAVMAVMDTDPRAYTNTYQYIRGVAEGFSLLGVGYQLLQEITEIRSYAKCDYLKDAYNWVDLTSALTLISVVPLRVLDLQPQWFVFSVGYLLTGIRLFKYAAIFKQTSVFVQILFLIMTRDVVQFMAVFFLILTAFSGAFILGLRGENSLLTVTETSSYWTILVTGTRTMFEAQPVVEYTGNNGYRWYCSTLMALYIFISCVVLLNLLIAQMSDSYRNIYDDVQGAVELNRAWIISRLSVNLPHACNKRKQLKYYQEFEDFEDTRVLKSSAVDGFRIGSNPLSSNIPGLLGLKSMLNKQDLNLRTMKSQLAKQGHQLRTFRFAKTAEKEDSESIEDEEDR